MGRRRLNSPSRYLPSHPTSGKCILKEENDELGARGKAGQGQERLPPAGRLVGPGKQLEGWGCPGV